MKAKELQFRYGELMYDLENTFDYFKRTSIISEMNIINCILNVPKIPNPNIYNKIKKFYL